jgi:hypothetical protein
MSGTVWGLDVPGRSLWYSTDGDNWISAGNPTGSDNVNGVWGPTSEKKVYVAVDGVGIYSYTIGLGWASEDAFTSTWPKTTFGDAWFLSTWCRQADDLVCCSGMGDNYNLIRSRPGPPGTAWATEYTGEVALFTEHVVHVHGDASGNYVFAIAHEEDGGRRSTLLQRSGGGTWSEVTGLGDRTSDNVNWLRVRVLSSNDVRIMGESDIGGTNYSKIWKWDGTTLTEEYSVARSSKQFMDLWMEQGQNGWMLDDEGGATPNDAVVDTGSGWAKKNDIDGVGESQSKYTVCAASQDQAWVMGWDLITKWNGTSWVGQFISGANPIFYQSFYARGVTLWAEGGAGYIWYSSAMGAVGSWTQVQPDPGWPGGAGANYVSVCGPTSKFKIYTCVTELGVCSWDGSGWTTEYDTGGDGPYHAWRRPDTIVSWCDANDTLVVASGFGDSNEKIVVRQGEPGATWYEEFDGEAGGNFIYPKDVAGTADGTHVFAIAMDETPTPDDGVLYKRSSGTPGSWVEVARRSGSIDEPLWVQVEVVSDTEVYIAGSCYDGVSYVGRIWKWNGSALSVVFTGTSDWYGITGDDCIGLWVAPDGSEGWACFHANDVGNEYEKLVRFNGATWSLFQAVEVSHIIHDVTQLPGDINSARAIYGRSTYDIFNRKGDGLWPNEYDHGYPPIENYHSVWYPNSSIAVNIKYIATAPNPLTSITHRLWAQAITELWYSDDGGDTWSEVDVSGLPSWMEGFWSAKSSKRLYTAVGGTGVYSYDWSTDTWTLEYSNADTYPQGNGWASGFQVATWCAANDSIACASGIGASNNQIATRPGTPGTGWSIEHTQAAGYVRAVHGSPDGAHIFALDNDASNYNLLKRSSGGSWSSVATISVTDKVIFTLRVVSDTEVRLFGYDYSGADTLKVWIWDGASLTEEYSAAITPGAANFGGVWMSEDGRDGLIVWDTTGMGASWRKTAGTWAVDDADIQTGLVLTAAGGRQNEEYDRILVSRGRFIRRNASGNWVDYSEEDIGTWAGSNPVGYMIGWTQSIVTTGVDTVDPYLQNQSPAPSTGGHARDVNIILEIIDDDSGVDESTVVLTVEGSTAWTGDAQQPGFAVTKTPVTNGFRYEINPDSDFSYEQVVDIGVDAYDLAGTPNQLSTSYNFTIMADPGLPVDNIAGFGAGQGDKFGINPQDAPPDVQPPELQNLDPMDGQGQIRTNDTIILEIIDRGSDVNPDTVELTVDGNLAWQSRTSQPGYTVVETDIVYGYRYTITPDTDMPPDTEIVVGVIATDYEGLTLTTSYSFWTASQFLLGTYQWPSFEQSIGMFDGKQYVHNWKHFIGYGGHISAIDYTARGAFIVAGATDGSLWTYVLGVWYRDTTEASEIANVWVYDETLALAINRNGKIYRWFGGTWTMVKDIGGGGNQGWDIHGSGTDNIWAAGAYGVMWRSIDGGLSWTSHAVPTGDQTEAVYALRSDFVICGMRRYSTDGRSMNIWNGATWAQMPRLNQIWGDENAFYVYRIWIDDDDDAWATVDIYRWYWEKRVYKWNGSQWAHFGDVDNNFSLMAVRGVRDNDVRIGAKNSVSGTDFNRIYSYDGYNYSYEDVNMKQGYKGLAMGPVDVTPPELLGQLPNDGQHGVPPDTNIQFDVVDSDAGVDAATVDIYVEGTLVWDNDAVVPACGYATTKSIIPYGYRYEINPDSDFSFLQNVTVRVVADDNDGNTLDSSYDFDIDIEAPIWVVGSEPDLGIEIGYDLVRRWNGFEWDTDSLTGLTGGQLILGILRGVWAADRNNCWVCGDVPPATPPTSQTEGSLAYWNGSYWTNIQLPGSASALEAIWGFSASDVWVCGQNKQLWHWNGATWTNESGNLPLWMFGTPHLYGIWGSAPDDIFVVGSAPGFGNAVIAHYNGVTWTDQASGSFNTLRSVHGVDSSTVLAVGDGNTAKRYTGASWVDASTGLTAPARDVWMFSAALAIAACSDNRVYEWNGASWSLSKAGAGGNDANGVYIRGTNERWVVGLKSGEASVEFYDGSWADQDLDTDGGHNYDIFGANPDTSPPVLQNQDPAPLETDVEVDHTVYLEIVDPSGVDASTVVLEVDSVVAWSGDAQQNGHTVVKTVIANGFSYEITPPADFGEGATITIDVTADDLAAIPNTLTDSYTFDVVNEPPVLQNQDPAPSETGVEVDHNVYLEIIDTGNGVDASSVVLTVGGTIAWSGDLQQNGFVVVKTSITDGFSYDIDPPDNFDEGISVTVDVVADDLAPTPNNLTTNYSFDTVAAAPPVLQNQNPAPSDTNVSPYTNIYLELVDTGSGVDASSVVLEVNSVTVWTGDAAPNPNYGVTKTPIADGYSYEIDPVNPFAEGDSITVDVVADDLAITPNNLTTSYGFDIIPIGPPVLQNQNPAPSQANVATDTNIYLEIVDLGIGLDESTVVLSVEGVTVWTGDAQQPGYVVTKTPIANGFSYDINPDALLPEAENVLVEVYAEDLSANVLNTSYTFDTISNPPYIDGQDPAPGSSGHAADKDITFNVKDVAGGAGLDLSTIRIWVEGNLAFDGSIIAFLPPYDGWNTVRNSIPNGYNFVIDKTSNWPYGLITVRCYAEDGVGNVVDETWDFSTTDVLGPLVDPDGPEANEADVSVDTNVRVIVSDESGIDTSTLQVEVDRGEGGGFELAFDFDGIPQFKTGWDGPASSVVDVAGVYTITIDPVTDFQLTTQVQVKVTALDIYGNPARL